MNKAHLILLGLWVLFCALHSLLASLWLKNKIAPAMGAAFRYYRLFYTLFAFASLGAVLYYQLGLHSPLLLPRHPVLQTGGYLLAASGLVVMAICIRKYFLNLSGLKSLYTHDQEAANELQVTGIHRFVRHPLYSGTFMAIWGGWLLLPNLSLLIANVVITGYTLLAIDWEEKKLIAEFGDSYRSYRKQVPRLVPMRGKSVAAPR